jgi:hypothetical protein
MIQPSILDNSTPGNTYAYAHILAYTNDTSYILQATLILEGSPGISIVHFMDQFFRDVINQRPNFQNSHFTCSTDNGRKSSEQYSRFYGSIFPGLHKSTYEFSELCNTPFEPLL